MKVYRETGEKVWIKPVRSRALEKMCGKRYDISNSDAAEWPSPVMCEASTAELPEISSIKTIGG
jgi:hypothetical protein